MSVRTFLDHLVWKYIKKNPHLYGLYNRAFYSDAEQTIEAIGVRLQIVPRKEPPYLKFARRTRGNHVFSNESPKILAFEANPDTFARLSRTCAGYDRIECHNVALSDRPGEIEMSEGGSSLVFGVAGGWNRGGRTHRLPAMPLDHYLSDATDIVLKIDVEGHEWRCCRGRSRRSRAVGSGPS